MAQARRRPPPGARRPPPGRRPPPRQPEYEDEPEEVLAPQPPAWERLILSRTFRLVVGSTFAAAAIALVIFLVGPGTISGAAGSSAGFVGRQSGRLGTLGSTWIAGQIQTEGRRLWVETATPLPTATATATPLPTETPFPTPPPPRRVPEIATTVPSKPLQPGQPLVKPPPLPPLPIDDAVASQREYFEIVSKGDVRRALQYWAPDSAPEARSALDAAIARGETYVVRKVTPRPLPAIQGVEMTVELEVTTADGRTTPVQHRYLWRFIESQWYITTRVQ